MKHLLIGLLAVLSALPKDQLLGSATGCTRRYLRRINGKCYYFSVKKMNWFGALNNCLRKGLTLADLSNQRDFYGAIGFLSSKGNTEDFWFGGNDLQHEGRFQYISNGRLVRFYSNYSIVWPAEHSECDDCLEVRIRANMTVVADDNCMERQYFICSERYCDDSEGSKKPRHHSHEHLHHFHHDIGEGSEDGFDDQTEPPIGSGTGEVTGSGSASEEVVGGGTNQPSQLPDEEQSTDEPTSTTESLSEPSDNNGELSEGTEVLEEVSTPSVETTGAESGQPEQVSTDVRQLKVPMHFMQ
ncbi:uncharacterized protein LOC115634443 [Scaptodrosophila lebanonensis]|uniref:Uncharacterized protein LOC115634443 n=1 Tax=Drosophila lebanonensis TaxID=7225 RepID=A0A6J2ULA5_DROLE|nr:uncharacterized protein LOC115634443 [Scaptodrosophila lebanonensis]